MTNPGCLRVQLDVDVESVFQGNNIITRFPGEQSQTEIFQGFWIVGAETTSMAQDLLLAHVPSVSWYKLLTGFYQMSLAWAPGNVYAYLSFARILCLCDVSQYSVCLRGQVAWLLCEDILFPSLFVPCYFTGFWQYKISFFFFFRKGDSLCFWYPVALEGTN